MTSPGSFAVSVPVARHDRDMIAEVIVRILERIVIDHTDTVQLFSSIVSIHPDVGAMIHFSELEGLFLHADTDDFVVIKQFVGDLIDSDLHFLIDLHGSYLLGFPPLC